MDDLISREDALMALTGEWEEPTDDLIYVYRFIRRIRDLPSVKPQPKTGQWLYGTYINDDSGHYYAECSECHNVRIIGNYCPNCGAKMIGSQESGE